VPIFSITPASTIDPAAGASVCASGSQVCSGHTGTLMAKASAKARNSHFCVPAASEGICACSAT